ncbi:MAG: gamma-glutamyl-gamma-aminobutyrate hydrolase family protein [Chloroflexi bacterium]|nr:gamma-glutamyl-gamma-aminobutyrate hydrolase family protein [Chloroflexota bacterium]MBP8054217.1 gamma-glutamyl-gamma-aminobutyrate hydrolase family protein [Chloroflexota bacterium]
MTRTPIIGITTYERSPDDHFMLPTVYVDAVRRAGGIVILIPPGEPHLDQLLKLLDGVIFSGGGDVDPAHYAGVPHPEIYTISPERDEMEMMLARKIIELGKPTLCICRGTQVLNVALGGTLIEHLPDVVGEAVVHREPPDVAVPHPVQVKSESRLARIMGATAVNPASWHHQAVRQPATGLEVVAYAADGTIEALEMVGHPWLMAVQWHPEITAAEDVTQQRLFDGLVNAAAEESDAP